MQGPSPGRATGGQQGSGLGEGAGERPLLTDEVALPKVQAVSRLPAVSIQTAWQMPLRNVFLRVSVSRGRAICQSSPG